MNSNKTFQLWDNTLNKWVSGTVRFNPDNCIKIAIILHSIYPKKNYSVHDVTSDNFSIEIYNTNQDSIQDTK